MGGQLSTAMRLRILFFVAVFVLSYHATGTFLFNFMAYPVAYAILGNVYQYFRESSWVDQGMVKNLDQILNPEKLATDAGVQVRSNILHLSLRTLISALFDPQGTFEEFGDFTLEEHTDRSLNEDFLRKKITRTLWETLVLSVGIAGLHYIGKEETTL